VDNAVQILDAAESAARSGQVPSDMTILITHEGGIRMVADSDWPLDSLQAHHGAKMAYRVSQSASVVRVEGRAGSRTCLFEASKPERAARLLLNSTVGCWTAVAEIAQNGVRREAAPHMYGGARRTLCAPKLLEDS